MNFCTEFSKPQVLPCEYREQKDLFFICLARIQHITVLIPFISEDPWFGIIFLGILDQQSVTKYYGNFKKCVSPLPYTMFRTYNIAWRNFCSLVLNIVKRGKEVETQNCPNSSFSHTFCHWLSEKIWKTKCSILQLLVLHQIEGIQLPITSQFCNA